MHRTRRRLIVALLAAPLAARALAASAKRVALLTHTHSELAAAAQRQITEALVAEGLAPGRDFVVELVNLGESADEGAIVEAARRIVASRPDVIAVAGTRDTGIFQRLTSEIPIVFRAVADPVAAGFVKSLAHPGGNITGESNYSTALDAKRLELLKEVRPGLRRVLVVLDPGPTIGPSRHQLAEAAPRLGLVLDELVLDRPQADPGAILARASASRAEGLLVQVIDYLHPRAQEYFHALEARSIPAIYLDHRAVEAGGLISLGQRNDVIDPTPVQIIARVLRGERPAQIPVAQMLRTHLALNLRTARAMRLEIPESIRLRADQVID